MFAVLIAVSLAIQEPKAKAQAKEKGDKDVVGVEAATPEQAIRTFIVAMMTKDAGTLRAVALPAADLDSLLQGQALPPESVEPFKAQVAQLPVRLLKAGEEITLADGRKYKARAEDVARSRRGPAARGVVPRAVPEGRRALADRCRPDHREHEGPGPGAAPKSVDPAQIKDKITINLAQKLDIQFNQKDGAISGPRIVDKVEAGVPTVHVEFIMQDGHLMLAHPESVPEGSYLPRPRPPQGP